MIYHQAALQVTAFTVFNATRPAKQYEFVGHVQTSVLSVVPLTVRISGTWSYVFSSGDKRYLAEHIQGETPAQAKAYLLQTGLITHVTFSQTPNLPDLYHIHFLILSGV